MKKTLSGEDPFGWASSLVGQAESRDDPKGPHVLTRMYAVCTASSPKNGRGGNLKIWLKMWGTRSSVYLSFHVPSQGGGLGGRGGGAVPAGSIAFNSLSVHAPGNGFPRRSTGLSAVLRSPCRQHPQTHSHQPNHTPAGTRHLFAIPSTPRRHAPATSAVPLKRASPPPATEEGGGGGGLPPAFERATPQRMDTSLRFRKWQHHVLDWLQRTDLPVFVKGQVTAVVRRSRTLFYYGTSTTVRLVLSPPPSLPPFQSIPPTPLADTPRLVGTGGYVRGEHAALQHADHAACPSRPGRPGLPPGAPVRRVLDVFLPWQQEDTEEPGQRRRRC